MAQKRRRHSLTPEGLSVERIEIGPEKIVAVARSPSRTSCCPSCGHASSRIHSRYQRSLADLPAHGRSVEIMDVFDAHGGVARERYLPSGSMKASQLHSRDGPRAWKMLSID